MGLACVLLMGAYACKREINQPLPGDYPPPSPVSKVEVVNIKGGAQLTYMLPQDGSVRYVEAVWSYNDVERSVKASAFSDTLLLEGFGDTLSHEIKVYSVNAGQQRSAPILVTIRPLPSPVIDVFQTLAVTPVLGGVKVTLSNDAGKPILLNVLASDSISGEMKGMYAYATSLASDSFIVTGFKPVEQQFGFFISDSWGTVSDTLYVTLTPIDPGVETDKSLWTELYLPNDVAMSAYGTDFRRMWDGQPAGYPNIAHSVDASLPHHFSIDLGRVYDKLLRFAEWGRSDYVGHNPAQLEVWGIADITGAATTLPPGDAGWSDESVAKGWTLLTTIDRSDDGVARVEARIIADAPPVRYIRIRVLKNVLNTVNSTLSEISFWHKQ